VYGLEVGLLASVLSWGLGSVYCHSSQMCVTVLDHTLSSYFTKEPRVCDSCTVEVRSVVSVSCHICHLASRI